MDQSFPTNFASVQQTLNKSPLKLQSWEPIFQASKQQSGPQNPHLSRRVLIVCVCVDI